jgi:hypothetical protein
MTAKKTYNTKAVYVPEAVDADGDGLIQDNTEFERPVETKITTHLVAPGENIQAVAEKYKPEGVTRNEYAATLYALNGDFREGMVVRL